MSTNEVSKLINSGQSSGKESRPEAGPGPALDADFDLQLPPAISKIDSNEEGPEASQPSGTIPNNVRFHTTGQATGPEPIHILTLPPPDRLWENL